MHLRGVPGVGRVDVVGAGAREADEVGRGAQQHVVARSRPRLVDEVLVVRVEGGVEEEVDRRPALARLDRVRLELRVEVVGAVDVAEVAHVLVVLGGAGEAEGVVAADRVADDLDERLEVVVEELRVEAGGRVRVPHQRARRRRVEAALLALLQLRGAEGEEVGALAAAHVDHLDVLAGLDLVGERRGAVDLEVEPGVGERVGQDGLALAARRRRARDLELEVGGGDAALDDGHAGRRGDPDDGLAVGAERLRRARRRGRAEELDERVRPGEPDDLGPLAAVQVADREPVVRAQGDRGRPARPHPERLASRVARHETRDEQAWTACEPPSARPWPAPWPPPRRPRRGAARRARASRSSRAS